MANDSGKTKLLIIPALTGFATLLIGIGIGRFGYPPLIPSIIKSQWFSVSQADYLGAANFTGYVVGSAFAAWLNRYIRSISLIRLALIAAILSFVLCAYPLSFFTYFLLRLVAGISGGIVMVLTAPTIFHHIHGEKKGVLGGIIFSGVGIGIAFSGTVIPHLVTFGLKTTWFVFALTSLVLMLLFWIGWPEGSNEKHSVEHYSNKTVKKSIWSKAMVFLLVSYVCSAVGFVPYVVFWVDFVSRGLHMGIQKGNYFWVLLGLSAALGPLITGYMADKVGFGKSIRISLFMEGIGVMMPIISTADWSLAISSILVGSLALGISSLAAGRVTELVLPGLQKKAWSMMTIGFSATNAITAYFLSFLFSLNGSYDLLFEIGAIALLIGSLVDFYSSKTTVAVNLDVKHSLHPEEMETEI